jgi:hypothetical protein
MSFFIVVVTAFWTGLVAGSIVPRQAVLGRNSSNVPRGCIGSNSSVASRPESLRMTASPPG